MEEFKISSQRLPTELMAALALVKRVQISTRQGRGLADRGITQKPAGDRLEPVALTSLDPQDPAVPAALRVAASVGLAHNLLPALTNLCTALAARNAGLQIHVDPLQQIRNAIAEALPFLQQLFLVAEGLDGAPNMPEQRLAQQSAQALSQLLELPFVAVSAEAAMSPSGMPDTWLTLHGHMKSMAVRLVKVSRDLQDNAPIAEETSPCHALAVVCRQVTANDAALAAGPNTPRQDDVLGHALLARSVLQSIRLLTDATTMFTEHLVRSNPGNRERLALGLTASLAQLMSPMPQAA